MHTGHAASAEAQSLHPELSNIGLCQSIQITETFKLFMFIAILVTTHLLPREEVVGLPKPLLAQA